MIHVEIAFFPIAFAAHGSSKLVRGILSKTKSMSDAYFMMAVAEGLVVPIAGAAPILLAGSCARSIVVAKYHSDVENHRNPQSNVNKKVEAVKLFTTGHLVCQGGSMLLGVPLLVLALPCLALQGAFVAAAKAAQKPQLDIENQK